MEIRQILEADLQFDPALLLLSIYPKTTDNNLKSFIYIYFTAKLFTVVLQYKRI